MPRLLLAEDDPVLGRAIKHALELEGHAVDWLIRGDDILPAVSTQDYSVILLDLGMPNLSGLDALRQLRAERCSIPVIIITAFDRTKHRVAGLDAGADDYMVKPLDLEELAARIRAQIRREDKLNTNLITVGTVTLDLSGNIVTHNGAHVPLTFKELRVLTPLMRRAGRFVSKTDLETALYDHEQGVESNTVEVAISALRRKLGHEFIVTARGLGYMVGMGAL